MDAIEVLKTRKSTRSYTDEPIDDSVLNDIIECGLRAPSAMNKQQNHITVLKDPAKVALLREKTGHNVGYGAPVLMIVHAPKSFSYEYTLKDGTCIMENLLLAAHAYGLGAVWIDMLKDFQDEEYMQKFGIVDANIVGTVALGYASNEAPAKERDLSRVTIL